MRYGTNSAHNLWDFSLEIMRHLLYFLAPILTLKVSCHFALLSLQAIHKYFAVLNFEMANVSTRKQLK